MRFGTRPEAITLAPVIRSLRKRSEHFTTRVASTGQHEEMVQQAWKTPLTAADLMNDRVVPFFEEHDRVAFRKKLYRTIAELQRDLNAWLTEYNQVRPHQGSYGKTPMQTFIDTLPVAKEKLMQAA